MSKTQSMKNSTTNSSSYSQNGNTGRNQFNETETQEMDLLQSSQLMKLFQEELKDIYWAEKELTKAIPRMINNAVSEELIEALENHLRETEEQIKRLEKVFESINKTATDKKCEGVQGLIKEADQIMEECKEDAMCDAGIISAAQKIEHYEIASYGTLCQFAKTLELWDAVELLEETLEEEKDADERLTEVAIAAVNVRASEQVLGEFKESSDLTL